MRQGPLRYTARCAALRWHSGDCCAAIRLRAEALTPSRPLPLQDLFPTNHYHRTSIALTVVCFERL
jgi:hypothetical protein